MKRVAKKIKSIIRKVSEKFGIIIYFKPKIKQQSSPILTEVAGYRLWINPEHTLYATLKQYPDYSANVGRIANLVNKKYPNMTLIDIGANIGDTVAICRSQSFFPIICIEGDDRFYQLLIKNLKQFPKTKAFKYFLDENDITKTGTFSSDGGTMKIEHGNISFKTITLDLFILNHLQSNIAKMIKTDTDGYDLKILRGGMNYIRENLPILFFEYDRLYLEQNQDDPLIFLNQLNKFGYSDIIYYDALGRFITTSGLNNKSLLKDLDSYIYRKRTPIYYYDVAVFHNQDKDIFRRCIEVERIKNIQP